MQKKKCTAIILAAGQGTRMGTKIQKQYLEIEGKPILYYSLRAFELSELIDETILVTGEGQEEYCRREIIEKYHINKVKKIVSGGAQRSDSVWNGLQQTEDDGYVFIHDGARPFIDEAIIERAYEAVVRHQACVVGMPVKDTIKIADANEFAKETPRRDDVWKIQTPQVFETNLVKEAYRLLAEQEGIQVTDDAMVLEKMLGKNVKLVRGSYKNIKITTPEDLEIAEVFAKSKKK